MLVKAAQRLPEIRFVLAGNGPLEDSVDGKNVHKLGFVSGRLLQTLIKNVEFVVSPSVCTETFGLSNGESIKLGTPVIATKLGAFPETVSNENGCLVEAGDERILADAIKDQRNDKSKVDRLRSGCKRTKLLIIEEYGKIITIVYE